MGRRLIKERKHETQRKRENALPKENAKRNVNEGTQIPHESRNIHTKHNKT